jgi:hypothetical protein
MPNERCHTEYCNAADQYKNHRRSILLRNCAHEDSIPHGVKSDWVRGQPVSDRFPIYALYQDLAVAARFSATVRARNHPLHANALQKSRPDRQRPRRDHRTTPTLRLPVSGVLVCARAEHGRNPARRNLRSIDSRLRQPPLDFCCPNEPFFLESSGSSTTGGSKRLKGITWYRDVFSESEQRSENFK